MNNLDKKSLRVDCLAKREMFNDGYRRKSSRSIVRYLLEAIPEKAKIVAGYCALGSELDLGYVLEALFARGHVLCLPVVVEDAPLIFRQYAPGDTLEKGRYNVEVPLANVPLLVPQAVIVPLIAFDSAGHRLGYGAGYYDRTIGWLRKHEKDVTVIGVAYSAQEVTAIPADGHDEKLDRIVTEKGIIKTA